MDLSNWKITLVLDNQTKIISYFQPEISREDAILSAVDRFCKENPKEIILSVGSIRV